MGDELWLPVNGYDGWYEASNLGQMRSWKNGTSLTKRTSPRSLRQVPTKGGYLTVCLSNRGPIKTLTVHSVVMDTFVGQRPAGMAICHADGNPANNRLDNLRYASASENNWEKLKHGTDNRGTRHAMHKLTEEQVQSIRIRAAQGETPATLAPEFGVTRGAIWLAVQRKSWSWLA